MKDENIKTNSFYLHQQASFQISKQGEKNPTSMSGYHYHNSYEIYYLLSGERYYFIKDKIYHVKPGSLVLISKYDVHYTGNVDNKSYERILINFRESYISDMLSSLNITHLLDCLQNDIEVIEFDPGKQAVIERILETMLTESEERQFGYDMYIKTALIQLLTIIERENNAANRQIAYVQVPEHPSISMIVGYINNHYSEDLNLKFISEKFYISPCHFSRKFKKSTGLSFVEYLNNVRIKEAKSLLLKTKMSVTNICEAVGFKTNTHFGRVFKEITGLSPLLYRKNYE